MLLGKFGDLALMISLKWLDFGLQTLYRVAAGIKSQAGIKQPANRIFA